MPIPHHNDVIPNDHSTQNFEDYTYYTDPDVIQCRFASYDRTLIREFNRLPKKHQDALTMASTGYKMLNPDVSQKEIRSAAEAFAHNVVEAKLRAGVSDIMVVYGEITANKPNVPQELPGIDRETFRKDSALILKTLYEGSTEGIRRAVSKFGAHRPNIQVRVVLHNDTEGEVSKRRKISTRKLSEENSKIFGIDHTKHQNIDQPTIKDILQYASETNKRLVEMERNSQDDDPPKIDYVLQVAHLLGVNVNNWQDIKANRTQQILDFFEETRKLEILRVQTDTSWLTASARYANYGLGTFLKRNNNEIIRNIGERIIRADKIANDCFMFFAEAERILHRRISSGDNEAETVETLALMRASSKKSFLSFYQEIGGIFDAIKGNPNIARELADYVNEDDVTEGNFIGLLFALSKNAPAEQDPIPFVWGADGLTQFAERSGVEKFRIYRDQHVTEPLMEIVSAALHKIGEHKSAQYWESTLTQLREGPRRDRKYWEPANQKLEVDVTGIEDTEEYDTTAYVTVRAAAGPVPLGHKPAVTVADFDSPTGVQIGY